MFSFWEPKLIKVYWNVFYFGSFSDKNIKDYEIKKISGAINAENKNN